MEPMTSHYAPSAVIFIQVSDDMEVTNTLVSSVKGPKDTVLSWVNNISLNHMSKQTIIVSI